MSRAFHLATAADPFLVHGGNLAEARRRFATAPEPWLDLSTGLNPVSYPVPPLPPEAWTRLPDPEAIGRAEAAARQAYGVCGNDAVVAVAGSQAAIAQLPALLGPSGGEIRILGPTYSGHAAAWGAAGRPTREVTELAALEGAEVAVVVNPNNPDGRLVPPDELRALAGRIARRGGTLVVDEAFMDVMPPASGLLAGGRPQSSLVLRSFGKAYGLAGLRLGFVVLEASLAGRLRATLGPWPVSGPALAVGTHALGDAAWLARTRTRLVREADLLDAGLRAAGLAVVGGTPLFRLASHPRASDLFEALGRAGILVRPFADRSLLRIGIPGTDTDRDRLRLALHRWAEPA